MDRRDAGRVATRAPIAAVGFAPRIARLCRPVLNSHEAMTVSAPAPGSRSRDAAKRGIPLSHHAIMRLIPPFSRRGYSLDAAGSDRAHGVLLFRPIEVPPGPNGRPALRCVVRLERPHRAKFRVIRTFTAADGQSATTTAEGDEPEALLTAIEQVSADRQFHMTAAGLIVRSYRAAVWAADASGQWPWQRTARALQLTGAEAQVGVLQLVAIDGDGWGCDVELRAREGAMLVLPTDFMAVLSWGWRPLRQHNSTTWFGRVSVAQRGAGRAPALEAQLDAAVAHMAATLAASPALFHRQHLRARWRAVFQRWLPLLFICGSIVVLVLALKLLPRVPELHTLLLHLSIVGVAGFFMMDDAYRVEVPWPPRPLKQKAWDMAAKGGLSPAAE